MVDNSLYKAATVALINDPDYSGVGIRERQKEKKQSTQGVELKCVHGRK